MARRSRDSMAARMMQSRRQEMLRWFMSPPILLLMFEGDRRRKVMIPPDASGFIRITSPASACPSACLLQKVTLLHRQRRIERRELNAIHDRPQQRPVDL